MVAELEKINWSDRLQFNVPDSASDKYNKFNAIIENSIDTVAPEHTVCISAKNRYVEPWVTQELIKTSKKKLKLYRLSLSTDVTDEVHQRYVSNRNKYNKLKHVLRLNYYNSKCIQYKNNIKQLCKSSNSQNNNKTNCIDCINVDNMGYYQLQDISNHLGRYFVDIGQNFTEKIPPPSKSILEYIDKIKRNDKTLFLNLTKEQEIKNINQLPNKTAVDMIILLKNK